MSPAGLENTPSMVPDPDIAQSPEALPSSMTRDAGPEPPPDHVMRPVVPSWSMLTPNDPEMLMVPV